MNTIKSFSLTPEAAVLLEENKGDSSASKVINQLIFKEFKGQRDYHKRTMARRLNEIQTTIKDLKREAKGILFSLENYEEVYKKKHKKKR